MKREREEVLAIARLHKTVRMHSCEGVTWGTLHIKGKLQCSADLSRGGGRGGDLHVHY